MFEFIDDSPRRRDVVRVVGDSPHANTIRPPSKYRTPINVNIHPPHHLNRDFNPQLFRRERVDFGGGHGIRQVDCHLSASLSWLSSCMCKPMRNTNPDRMKPRTKAATGICAAVKGMDKKIVCMVTPVYLCLSLRCRHIARRSPAHLQP